MICRNANYIYRIVRIFINNANVNNMKTTPNQRLKQFRIAADLETEDLSEITGISKSLIEKMEAGQMNVSEKTAKTLKDKCRVQPEWLLHGIGELKFELTPVNPYRDYLLKRNNEEVVFLRNLIMQITGGKNINFLKALNPTGFDKKKSLRAVA